MSEFNFTYSIVAREKGGGEMVRRAFVSTVRLYRDDTMNDLINKIERQNPSY